MEFVEISSSIGNVLRPRKYKNTKNSHPGIHSCRISSAAEPIPGWLSRGYNIMMLAASPHVLRPDAGVPIKAIPP